jgi:superfamily II RNA helicase
MAGRAGRRGIDKKGVVIHLNNMFDLPPIQDYRNMLCGKSQTITSKFQINFNLILNLIANKTPYLEFISRSLMNISIQNQRRFIEDKITKLDQHLVKQNELLQFCKTPIGDLKTFANLLNELGYSDRKRRKKILKNIQLYKNNHKNIEKEVSKIFDIDNTHENKYELQTELKNLNNYIADTINTVLGILIDYNFIETPGDILMDSHILTTKGEIAANIQEVNCLVFADLIHYNRLKHFDSQELAAFFSCFSNISIPREDRRIDPFLLKIPTEVKQVIVVTQTYYDELKDIELKYQLDFSEEELHYELCEEIIEWCGAIDERECKIIFQKLKKRNISIGVFIKAILKINNIAAEFEKLFQHNLPMLEKLREIPRMTLKFVVTNQSLYI